MRKLKHNLVPIEEQLDSLKQTSYCIDASREHIQNQKKEEFQNKLCFSYSLNKINKQKMYGQLIEASARLYPKIMYEGRQFTAHQYSAPRIRDNRRSFILYKQIPPPQHKQQIKRYSQLLSKKKQKQGGLDSFWMFKKEAATTEQKKTRGKNNQNQQKNAEEKIQNKVQQAFCKILIWGHMAGDIETGLISKNLLKNYLNSQLGQCFAEWFINFLQIKSYLSYKQYQIMAEKFKKMSLRQSHLISFQLYDQNGDGFICPRDVFSVFERQIGPSIQQDVIMIAHYTQNNAGRQQQVNDKFKIEHIIIRDDFLTIKDYEMYFKKVDQPYLRATNKKDTGFSKTFAVLDHRQKVRSTRRELNQKKMMYNDLFGQITKERKNRAYVQNQDYRLNYTFFHEIFPLHSTNLFNYFCNKILGITYLISD